MKANAEEKKQILEMLTSGKITQEQAMELLNALDMTEEETVKAPTGEKKFLRVRVDDKAGGDKVNVNIPLGLVKVGLKLASKYADDEDLKALEKIDFDEVLEMIEQGAEGKLVEVETKEGEKVEVYVE
jgi:2-methylcitrate dehydratase PrpD